MVVRRNSLSLINSSDLTVESFEFLGWAAVGMKDAIGVVHIGAVSLWSDARETRRCQSASLDPRKE